MIGLSSSRNTGEKDLHVSKMKRGPFLGGICIPCWIFGEPNMSLVALEATCLDLPSYPSRPIKIGHLKYVKLLGLLPFRFHMLPMTNFGHYVNVVRAIKGPEEAAGPRL